VLWSPFLPPREFDYFRRISDAALEAGASIDDCESSDLPPLDGRGMLHTLVDLTLLAEGNAFAFKLPHLVAYFVKIGFSIESPNFDGETPFLYAASRCGIYSTFLQILLEHGANPTAKDKWGRGALHLAIYGYWGNDGDSGDDDDGSSGSGGDDDDGDDASVWDGSGNAFALTSRDQDEVRGLEQYPATDVQQSLLEKLLFLLHADCDPEVEDDDGLTVCGYAKKYGLSSTWHTALFTFDAER
jgi:Ankyrin repeat